MPRVAGICGQCGTYYKGESCTCSSINTQPRTGQEFEGEGYYDHGLGRQIRTRGQRKMVMKELGVQEVGNEWDKVDPVKVREAQERVMDKQYEALGHEAIRELRHNQREPQWN